MRYHEIISEAPQLIAPTDFDLSDPLMNRTMLATVTSKDPEILIDNPAYVVALADEGDFGRIAMTDKRRGSMIYFVEYEVKSNFIGRAVTQVTLWRNANSSLAQGITSKIFNDILLRRWHTIVSDEQQTPDGERFWRTRMAVAASVGERVGLANMAEQEIRWFDAEVQDFEDWIEKNHAWGTDPSYKNLRYVISN